MRPWKTNIHSSRCDRREEKRRKETHAGHNGWGGAFREPIKACFTRADNTMKDANCGQSCLKSVCNRTIRPPSFTVTSNPRGFAAFHRKGRGRAETGLAPTPIIYQFRILMSSRLIQKASTLRKPKRSWLAHASYRGWTILRSPSFSILRVFEEAKGGWE